MVDSYGTEVKTFFFKKKFCSIFELNFIAQAFEFCTVNWIMGTMQLMMMIADTALVLFKF